MKLCCHLNELLAVRHSLEQVPCLGNSNKIKGDIFVCFLIDIFIKHLRDTIIWYTCNNAFTCND